MTVYRELVSYLKKSSFNELLDVVLYGESSSSDSSSSEEDDLDILLLEVAFALKLELGLRINLEDISEMDCERMFR